MGHKQDLPGRLSGDFRIHKLEKIVAGWEGKKKYPAKQCTRFVQKKTELLL